jgi:dTMP kinase
MGVSGLFITFEGGEGAGKSTQVKRLGAALEARGHQVVLTREPGGAPGAEAIRKLLVEGAANRWDGVSEALLHTAARRDHLVTTVWPALKAGKVVISDRFADSTLAYQGYGHGVDHALLASLYAAAAGAFKPDLTLILDVPLEIGLSRAVGRGGHENRYETMDRTFHARLRDGFLAIAAADPKRCRVIDASGDMERIQARIWEAVEPLFVGVR